MCVGEGGAYRLTKSVAVIGLGAIGRTIADGLLASGETLGPRLACVLVRGGTRLEADTALAGQVPVLADFHELIATGPDIAVECAGQDAVVAYGPDILSNGIDLMVSSTGALADRSLFEALTGAAVGGGARILIPAGAIAGLDGLAALRLAGLASVTYRSSKPPVAWRETEAERLVDLDAIDEPTTFFAGNAREAAVRFPKNANLAATVALAGLGFEETRVELVADPRSSVNVGTLEVDSEVGTMTVVMSGKAAANPKTSASTAFSLLHAIRREAAVVVI